MAAQRIVDRLEKLRDSYRRGGFTLFDGPRANWMKSARILLVRDQRPARQILDLLDYAATTSQWPPHLKSMWAFRQYYPDILDDWRRQQVADIPHEPWGLS